MSSSALTLSSVEVESHLIDWGIDPEVITLPDENYSMPVPRWVFNEFAKNADPLIQDWVGNYEVEDADCDDFAEFCAAYAHMCHRKTLNRPRETALAFGEFWFVKDTGEAHAINCFIGLQDNEWHLFFFEPQTCKEVILSHKEISSCVSCRF